MRWSRLVFIAVASTAFLGAANLDVFAQAAQTDASAATATFDESLLDVQDGEKAEYYENRLAELANAFQHYASVEQDDDRIDATIERVRAAFSTIFKNLSDSQDLDAGQRDMYFSNSLKTLVSEGKTDEIEALQKKNADDPRRAKTLKFNLFASRLVKAERTRAPQAELEKIAADIRDAALADETFAGTALMFLSQIRPIDDEIGKKALEDAAAAFAASNNDSLKKIAKIVESRLRFEKLVGSKINVEGLFLDGTEIDWASYRGKVVLLFFWTTRDSLSVAEIPNLKKAREKYGADGFEIVGYSLDVDLAALEKFEKEKTPPWKTASRKRSQDAEKEYLDLTEYYGISQTPTAILVGKDGDVLDTNARGGRLQELLKKEFPEER